MTRNLQLASLVLLAGLAGTYMAQAQPPIGPGQPGQAEFAGVRPPQPPGFIALTTLSGTVQQLTANDDAVLNGFILNTGEKTVAVQFPPHLGQAIQAAGKQGGKVTITGSSDVTSEGEAIFRLVSLTNGQAVVDDAPSAVPVVPPTLTPITVKGKVVDYQLDRQGQVMGIRLGDQLIIRVPPHLVAQFLTIAPKGSTISVEGYARPIGEGEVRLKKQTIVEASQLTTNGQSFLVR